MGQEILHTNCPFFLKDKLLIGHKNMSYNIQNMPYNTRNPIKSTLNTGTNLIGIVSFVNTSLFHLARGMKHTFYYGRQILNLIIRMKKYLRR